MKIQRVILYLLLAMILAISFMVIRYALKEQPTPLMNQARQRIAEAENGHSDLYSPEMYSRARASFDSAMNCWIHENKKLFFRRNFDQIKSLALLADSMAQQALKETIERIRDDEDLLDRRIASSKSKQAQFLKQYGNFPFQSDDYYILTRSKHLLKEATLAFEKNQYPVCKTLLDSSEWLLQKLAEHNREKLETYMTSYDGWKTLTDNAIAASARNRKSVLIIDKYARECLLYTNGSLKHTFSIDLGSNWMGNKNYQGDKSTPEGTYKIVSKKANGSTRYYKAFLLNYPSDEDLKRFNRNKKKGFIKPDASIGHSIEIHGHGGQGYDWTDGCIALSDANMDILYAACQVGTPVIIVGSLNPLTEIMASQDE